MQYLCEGYTTGGPIVIIQLRHLQSWDGDKDYHRAIAQTRDGLLQVLFGSNNTNAICLFHQEVDGNFHIYYDRMTAVVLSERYAEEGHEIRFNLPDVARWISSQAPVRINNYGGKIAIFDAALPGEAISLRDVGCEIAQLRDEESGFQYDAALIEIEVGTWEVLELHCREEALAFDGILFRLIDSTTRSKASP